MPKTIKPSAFTAKLQSQIEDITEKQTAILTRAEASESGDLTDVDTKEFDALEEKKARLKANLERSQKVDADAIAASVPARQPIVSPLGNPSTNTLFATPRRHGKLKSFKGEGAGDRAFASGMWFAANFFPENHPLKRKAGEFCESHDIGYGPNAATMTTTNNAQAGFLIPTFLSDAIVNLQLQYGVFRQYAENVQMPTSTHSTPRKTTRMSAYWTAEGAAATQSESAWDMINLVAKDLKTKSKMTRNVSEDAIINLGDDVANDIALAFAYAEDNAGFNGDGTSTYGGITGIRTKLLLAANSACLSTATGHTTPDALDMGDFTAAEGNLAGYANINPAWFCHKSVYAASMAPLMLTTGGATKADIEGGSGLTFNGYPVVFTEVLPKYSAATTGTLPIIFGDLSMCAKLGDRRESSVEMGFDNDDFSKGLITVVGTERVDINVHTLTDPNDSTIAGPVVGLKLG